MKFKTEDDIRKVLINWLRQNSFIADKGLKIHVFEIDTAAVGKKQIIKTGFKDVSDILVYSFEVKFASTPKLVRDVIEQAIVRLLFSDFVYIVTPHELEVWLDEKSKKKVNPFIQVKSKACGYYSRKIGIMSITPEGKVFIHRTASKSTLKIDELRRVVINKLYQRKKIMSLFN